MKLRRVPARQGAAWVRQGLSALLKNPLQFTALFTGFMLSSWLLAYLVPWVGNLVAIWSLPLITLSFMATTRQAVRGEPLTPFASLALLRTASPSRRALVQLGFAYLASLAAASGLAHLLYGGVYQKLFTVMTHPKLTPAEAQALLQTPGLLASLVVPTALMGLVSAVFWHAPALAHWGGQGAVRSLFFSWLACWRNKGAFLVYGLAWMALMMFFTLFSQVVLGILGLPPAYATAPAVLMFSTAFYASLYYTYADCFDEGETAGAAQPGGTPPGPSTV